MLTSFYRQHFGARRRASAQVSRNSLLGTTSSSPPFEMVGRTRSHAQHSDLPPSSADPVQEQSGQQDLNNLHVEEVFEYRPGKELIAVDADDDANLGELMRSIERLEDVIGAI